MLKSKARFNQICLLVIDIMTIVLSFLIAVYLRLGSIDESFIPTNEQKYLYHILFILVCAVVFYIFDLYNLNNLIKTINIVVNSIVASIAIGISLTALFYVFPDFEYGRGIWFIQIVLIFILIFTSRYFYIKIFSKYFMENIRYAIIGDNITLNKVKELGKNEYLSFAGFIHSTNMDCNYLGNIANINNIMSEYALDMIIIQDNDISLSEKEKAALINLKINKNYIIYDVNSLYEHFEEKIFVDEINNFWLLLGDFSIIQASYYARKIKRIFDVILSMFCLIIAFPFACLVSIAIKITSKGPVIYSQERTGKGGNYKIYKFRSMTVDAEKNGAVWASKNDNRVTAVGKFIRKTRLDEIPQLLNILKGDMTFVGPRPERPEFIKSLVKEIKYYSLRHTVKPGLTGWAQIKYPYGASVEDAKEKLQYDLYYIKKMSFILDLKILLKTIKVMIFGAGGR